jgi:hypothetical protein
MLVLDFDAAHSLVRAGSSGQPAQTGHQVAQRTPRGEGMVQKDG